MKVKSNINGVCPMCNSTNLDYGALEFETDMLSYYPWRCNDCHTQGEEWYVMSFSGHNLIDEEGNSIEIEEDMIENTDSEGDE